MDYITLNLSTNGSRIKISGCGTTAANGVYTSITCDGKTQPSSSTYGQYKYTHTNGQYYLHIYQYSSSTYYWRIYNSAGNTMYYRSTTNSTSSGVAINNLTFPWADASVPWYTNSGTAPAPSYFSIEFCGNIPSWAEGGLIYGDNFTVTLATSGTKIKLVYDDSYRIFKPYPTTNCVWSNADGFRVAWQTRNDNRLPSSYLVSGAGSTYVNGVYEYYQDYQNKPAYKLNTGTTACYLLYTGTYWIINSSLSTTYPLYMNYSSGSSATPPASGWSNSNGSSPAPTISEILGGYGWWSCTYNGTEMYKTSEIAKTTPQQFPWEYLSHQFIKVNGTEDITMSSPGSRIVIKGSGNTSIDGKTFYSLTDDENTTLSSAMGTTGYVYHPEWKSEDGQNIIGPYSYYVNSTSGYRWTIRYATSSSSMIAYTTNYASSIGALTTKPWNDETWTTGTSTSAVKFGPSTILYQGRGYRPTGFSNRLEVFGSESYPDAMGTYDIIGFYWSDAAGTTFSNEAEISGGKFYAIYTRREDVTESTWFLRADNDGIRLGHYIDTDFVTCETGSATMYPQNATWSGGVTVLAAENSHVVPMDRQYDAIITSGETTITTTILHPAYGVCRIWVDPTDNRQTLSYTTLQKWECTGQIVGTYRPSLTTNDQGLLYVEGPYNTDGSAITYSNGTTVAGDVPQGIFKIEGITGTHAAANGNYNLLSGTEGTLSAVYKHVSADYYVFTPSNFQGWWCLYNSVASNFPTPMTAYAYMGSSGTLYPYNQTSSVTWTNGSGSVGASMTSTKL